MTYFSYIETIRVVLGPQSLIAWGIAAIESYHFQGASIDQTMKTNEAQQPCINEPVFVDFIAISFRSTRTNAA